MSDPTPLQVLQQAIMNLRPGLRNASYVAGHRDARHAAAELVAAYGAGLPAAAPTQPQQSGFNDPDRVKAWDEAGQRIQREELGLTHLAAPQSSRTSVEAPANAPSAEGSVWVSVTERMPEPGTECLVIVANGILGPYISTDCWDELREAPVSFSTVTVPVGFVWGSYGDDEISHWMPAPELPASGALDSGASTMAAAGTPATPERDDKTAPAPASNVEPNEQGDPA